jgi:Zn-dependent protease
MVDTLTRQAITHTRHCLTGCAIGEIMGMVIGEALSWKNIGQTILSIILAFFFGYLLTFRGARRQGMAPKPAFKTALATDTVSITSMEAVDNSFIWLVPGAINATLGQALFWWSLSASLAVAFVITVPVNRFMISRGIGHNHHH